MMYIVLIIFTNSVHPCFYQKQFLINKLYF